MSDSDIETLRSITGIDNDEILRSMLRQHNNNAEQAVHAFLQGDSTNATNADDVPMFDTSSSSSSDDEEIEVNDVGGIESEVHSSLSHPSLTDLVSPLTGARRCFSLQETVRYAATVDNRPIVLYVHADEHPDAQVFVRNVWLAPSFARALLPLVHAVAIHWNSAEAQRIEDTVGIVTYPAVLLLAPPNAGQAMTVLDAVLGPIDSASFLLDRWATFLQVVQPHYHHDHHDHHHHHQQQQQQQQQQPQQPQQPQHARQDGNVAPPGDSVPVPVAADGSSSSSSASSSSAASSIRHRRTPDPAERRRQAERQLREEQEAAFAASLAADQERARAEREAAEAEAEAARVAEEQAAAAARALEAARDSLPPEPAEGDESVECVVIAVRLPDGSRLTRRFPTSAAVRHVYAFVDVSQSVVEPGEYVLQQTYPRASFHPSDETLDSLGLKRQAMLQVAPK